jgi:ParB-like chromosome segregation protein Spo0J
VGADDHIIAGHARLLAVEKLGLKEVPVILLRHLSPAQRRALVKSGTGAYRLRASTGG